MPKKVINILSIDFGFFSVYHLIVASKNNVSIGRYVDKKTKTNF